MNKKITTLALAILLAATLTITGCGLGPDDEAQNGDQATPVEIGYDEHILGTWYFVTTAPGVKIESNIFFHRDGNAYGSFGQVTIPEIPTPQAVDFSNSSATWSVSSKVVTMVGQNGRVIKGNFSDVEHMNGTVTDANGVTANWTATKVANYVLGDWNISILGFGGSEIARHYEVTINPDGTVTTHSVKVQQGDGSIIEHDIYPGESLFTTYTVDGDMITIESTDGQTSFQGAVGYDDYGSYGMDGSWATPASGDSGIWHGASLD